MSCARQTLPKLSVVWIKGQNEGEDSTGDTWNHLYALEFDLGQIGNALPQQSAIDEGELDGTRTAGELARFIAAVNNGIQIAARARASADEVRSIARMAVDTVC